jgi:hypothetical protein
VAALQVEVTKLKRKIDAMATTKPWWRQIAGWPRFYLAMAAIVVFAAALFLYLIGLELHAGLVYSFAVIVLFCFALAGAVALALLIYALFRRWCALRGAPPKGQGTRENSGPGSAHLPATIYKRPDPLIYSQAYLMARGLAVTWDNPDIWLTELPAPDGTLVPVASNNLVADHVYRIDRDGARNACRRAADQRPRYRRRASGRRRHALRP